MKMTLQSTDRIVEVNGVPARVWEGTTERGTKVAALITRVAAPCEADCSELERDLQERHAPASAQAYAAIPARMIV